MRSGTLVGTDAEHPASGEVVMVGGEIRLEKVSISEAPDPRVILTKNFDEPSSVACGDLKGFTGSHDYEIPAGTQVSEYDSVVIWCDQAKVAIGQAKLSD